MMYANLGNIDTYITARHSIPDDGQVFDTSGEVNGEAEPLSAEDRKKLFKRRRLSSKIDPGFKFNRHDVRGVMLFSREEVESLFGDVVEGLAFLVRIALPQTMYAFEVFNGEFYPALQGDCPPRYQMPKYLASSVRGGPNVRMFLTRSAP